MSSRERAKELWEKLHARFAYIEPHDTKYKHELDLIESALAAPALGWTSNLPSVEGHYWYRSHTRRNGKQSTFMVEIELAGGRLLVNGLQPGGSLLVNYSGAGEFAGPILPPPDTRENG